MQKKCRSVAVRPAGNAAESKKKMRKKILIADSGSTKTDWALWATDGMSSPKAGGAEGEILRFRTEGINPYYQSAEEIGRTLCDMREHLRRFSPAGDAGADETMEVHFYGAGCTEQKIPLMRETIGEVLKGEGLAEVHVSGDLLAAAHALCGRESGVACILGTGSNSCFYDGERIVSNVSPLGFILGDEGSGAVLGKLLIGALLKEQLGADLKDEFLSTYGLSPADLIEHVYRQPFPNRFLAGFAPFLSERLARPEIHAFCAEAFAAFFRRNVLLYPQVCGQKTADAAGEMAEGGACPVHLTGSVAYHFRSVLQSVAQELGIRLGRIEASPLNGLVRYHAEKGERR